MFRFETIVNELVYIYYIYLAKGKRAIPNENGVMKLLELLPK